MKQAIGEADIYIASENPYQGTGRYFSRLARQYRPWGRHGRGRPPGDVREPAEVRAG